jgi:hypothetical protein
MTISGKREGPGRQPSPSKSRMLPAKKEKLRGLAELISFFYSISSEYHVERIRLPNIFGLDSL